MKVKQKNQMKFPKDKNIITNGIIINENIKKENLKCDRNINIFISSKNKVIQK